MRFCEQSIGISARRPRAACGFTMGSLESVLPGEIHTIIKMVILQ